MKPQIKGPARGLRTFLSLCAALASLACRPALSADAALAALPVVKPVVSCASLAQANIDRAVDAKVTLASANEVADGKPAPYCRVLGTVAPEVKIEVRLPLNNWTQRYVQTGCGGLCGMLNASLHEASGCVPADNGELALASTDMGHSGGGNDGEWGATNYAARVDFAYRAEHVTALAAKALIAAYYGQAPKYSYFVGCSDGGREALMEAQRYPQDFNGITAGAAAMNFTTQNTFYHGWNARMNSDSAGRTILTADKLPIVHAAVLEQCDAADGLKDGLVSDPFHCHPDLSTVQCKPGQDPSKCLTAEQVHVVLEIFRGAHDAAGHALVISGPLPGSELNWVGVYVPAPGRPDTMSPSISVGVIKNIASDPNPPADFTLAQFQFTLDSFKATTKLHGLYDSTDPDLSAFAAGGGKLVLWHGLADPHISPLNTIAYYDAVRRTLGAAKADQFLRLFLFPGGGHCAGGQGPMEADRLSAIMSWVERGHAPSMLIAAHRSGNSGYGAPPGPVDRTRPVYAYPMVAKYTGRGSIDDAANFTGAQPLQALPTKFEWAGASFYGAHQELWCDPQGAKLNCSASP
jgi:feruloyl esterase